MTEIKRTSQNKPLQRQGESVSPLSRYSNSPSYGVRTEEVISQTLADVIQNVIVGAVKSLEGIADVGQTIVGGIGGIFDSGFRDQIQKNVAYDWTMETFGNDWENQLRNSALNNNKVGGFVENVAQGVGGMLPAVAVTLATGGLGAPAAVGQALSLGTMATGAAGQSTEEAYKEGAGYLQGALYGAASGAIEAATEKMFGGVSSAIYGKGIMDGAVKSVGRTAGESVLKQTAKRIGKEALEEGVEEVVSELASPLAKSIYKGGDALKEYGNPEYWKGVAEAGLAGSATALAYAGTVGYGMSKIKRGGKPLNYVGKEANIAEAVESIETEKERILKMADNSKISEKALKTSQENIKAYYADIQANLTSMSEKARSQAISDMSLEKAFNPDGTMTEDFSKQLDYDGGISEGKEAPKAKYHSLNMSAEDVDKAISNNNAKAMTDSFTEEEEISYREFKKAFGKLRRASGNNLKYVVVDSMEDGNAYFDPETNAIVIGRDQMGKMNENISDAWKQSIVHEAFHFSQGTKSASKVISKLLDSDDIANEIFNDMQARGYDTAIVKKYLSGEDMNAEETEKFNEFRDEFEAVLMEHALGNDAFISKLVRDDITTAQRMLNGINDAKEVFTKDKKIRKAERMYLKAVEEAGMTYEGRKILAKKEEDDEEKNENTIKDTENKNPTSNKDMRYSLKRVSPVQPTDGWKRSLTFDEVKEKYPNLWDVSADESDTKNPTSVKVTVSSYDKIYDFLKQEGFKGKILDASSGLGYGTELGADKYGFDVEDVEPFPGDRHEPTYRDYEKIKKKYDVIISNAVLNVLPQDIRDSLVMRMKDLLAPGGRIFVNVRGDDVLNASSKDIIDKDNLEVYISNTGSYQKGFKKPELVAYLQDALGNGYDVKPTSFFGKTSAIVTRKDIRRSNKDIRWSRREDVNIEKINPTEIVPVNEVKDKEKYDYLVSSFRENGWNGRPIVVVDVGNEYRALTGSHRIYAAREADIDVDAIVIPYSESVQELLDARDDYELASTSEKLVKEGAISKSVGDLISREDELNNENYGISPKDQIRYSRKEPDIEGRRIQKTAKYSAERVFTLTEARRVLDNVLSTAVAETLDDMDYSFSSSKASKEDVAKVFWKNLNTATDEEVQKKVALDMADYAIRNLTAEAVYTDEETEGRSNAIPRLDAYSTLFGVIDRKGTVLKKNIKALLETMPLDQVKDYLADAGITIDAETEADAVEEIWKKYKADVDTLSNHIRQTLDSLGEETVAKMKQEIADSIVEQYRKNGKRSTARSMIDYAFDVARKWHDRLVEANRLNKVEDQWERQMRSKTAKGNVQYFVDRELASSKDDPTLSEQLTTFKDAVDAIYSEVNTKTKLHSRAKSLEIIRSSAARILAWFENTNNPVVQYLKDAGDYDSVRDLISSVANLGTIDADSLKMALNMVKVITHIAEFANTVYVDNKRFDITEQAYKYNVIADTTMSVPSKFRNWLLNTWYKYTGRFSDPSSLFLAADGYDPDGFFSTMYRSFRDASVKAVETLNDLLSPMEDYFKEHKQWYKGLSGRTATINGTEVPMEIAMSFYCTLHRPHAWEGALTAGFAYTDTNGVRHEVKPFMSVGEYREMLKADKENGTTEVADKVNEIMGDISSQMTETDMGYIDLVWDMMDKARALKEKTDITRMGVSNVEQGMYYPIGRDNQNLKIEDDFGEEMQNIRNYSFNKNTVRGANGRLFIKPVTRVVNLHARGMANYANLTMPIENYYKVMNYKVSGTSRSPDRIKDKVQKIWTEALPYMQKYIQDMQGIGTNADTFLSFMRGNFAAAQLGLNPKVLLTQLSSLFAASNILKYKYYTRGFGVGARTKASVLDEHSAVAKMRYEENEAVLAQANLERKAMHTKKGQVREGIRTISEKTTSLIGMMDRNVIRLLYGVCQVQVEAEQGLKVGTEENLKASADLLNRVIFETQQNAYSTERSAAMRSNNELLKTLTMFTADQVKIVGRLIDSIGTVLHLKAEMKAHPGRPGLEERLKQAQKQVARSAAALVEVAAFIAMVAALFRKLFRKEEENEAETIAVDFAGNLLGGLPIISDAYDYFTNGYEVSSPQYDMINNTFKAFTDTIGLMDKAANGTLTDNDIAKAVRSTVFSTSQLVGLPVRNAYNVATGITRLVSPEAGLKVDSLFNSQLLAKEFNDAMEKGDGEKAEMIARLIAKERVEGLTEQTEKEYGRLMAEDYNILPPSVGDTITYDDTEYTLSAAQRKAFKAIQAQADDAVSRMIQTKEYKNADDAIKAKAIRWMNQVYYNLAVEDLTGVSIEDKTVLFSRAVDVSKLAIILAQASGIKADTDKEGKQIVGTRKAKIVALLERQTLKAAQKYMILGYLGYKNTTGEQAVRTYIQSLKLTRAQKEKLFSYCGYGE